MSIICDINNISRDNLNKEEILLINLTFEDKKRNKNWELKKNYDSIIIYLNDLVNKISNVSRPPMISQLNNNLEIFKSKLKEYINNLLTRKEIHKLFSFQKFFEFPDELLEKQIIIDTLSNITEYNILDFYFYDPYLFISTGNLNSIKALSFLFSFYEVKGFYLIYEINTANSYGEKKLKEIYKKENEKYVTKIKIINDFLMLGYNNGSVEIFNLNMGKKLPSIYSTIENIESKMSVNENFKIANMFCQQEKGLLYIFIEKDRKVCIYDINNGNHIKDIQLSESSIAFSYINFSMNKIFIIDFYGTFKIYELIGLTNNIKLLQASYTKLNDISTTEIFNEKNNEQTINIFVGTSDKVYLYQYSNKDNIFSLKIICDIQFKIKSIKYVNQYKCLLIGCNNGTIQIWKDSSKYPEYIIESGYSNIDKLFYDNKNKYIFISNEKNLKIMEINLEKILNDDEYKDENSNKNTIGETLKDEGDKVEENNMIKIIKAYQTSESTTSSNEPKINNMEDKEKNKQEDKIIEELSDLKENNINYEVRSIGSLDGWDEW